MARGKNTARSSEVARKKHPDPAEEAESRLRHLHAVGREALARFPVGAAHRPRHGTRDRRPRGAEARQHAAGAPVARGYSEKDLEELCRLRTPGGIPLSWGHVRRLVSIPNKATCAALQKRWAREGWTAAQLSEVIQRELVGRKRRYGGRPFTAPRTPEEGLRQVVLRSEQWLRRCRESWSGEAAWLAAGSGVSKGSADHESLVALLEVARRLLLEVGRAALEQEARLGNVTLWPNSVGDGVEEMLRRNVPKLRFALGPEEVMDFLPAHPGRRLGGQAGPLE